MMSSEEVDEIYTRTTVTSAELLLELRTITPPAAAMDGGMMEVGKVVVEKSPMLTAYKGVGVMRKGERIQVCKLGTVGSAYDMPGTYRAFTYTEQPGNLIAWKLGRAFTNARAGGDFIDAGLSLLKELEKEGYGVFQIDTTKNGRS